MHKDLQRDWEKNKGGQKKEYRYLKKNNEWNMGNKKERVLNDKKRDKDKRSTGKKLHKYYF